MQPRNSRSSGRQRTRWRGKIRAYETKVENSGRGFYFSFSELIMDDDADDDNERIGKEMK